MLLAAAAPAHARQRSFHTPSGDISCLFRSGGPFRCRSRTTRLTCRCKPSGHGFKLARERQYTF